MAEFPARIHVLLARDASVGVVIRRGPSKQVATVLWDRERDTFQMGQWLKGRIFERRSDLSPDGKYLIYFAMNGRWESESRGSWTAISRAPYLKALAFFPKGDCWQGGGLRTSNKTYWFNEGFGHSIAWNTDLVRRDTQFEPSEVFNHECLGVYYPRLLRDGWRLMRHERVEEWRTFDVLEKPLRYGWILRKIAHLGVEHAPGKGVYWDEHELVHAESGAQLAFPDWEWAEQDGERLVWASGGKLYCGDVGEGGLMRERELYDFNSMTFERIAAPY